jgi:pentatricopeptide repeat protein
MNDEDKLMLERGNLFFRQGDVAAARLIYNRMAKKGFAPAALAMAQSYDPKVLKKLKVQGLQPNLAKARRWYRTAKDLGSQKAESRLGTQ